MAINKFQEEVEFLKSIINKTELKKTFKWGADVYTFNGKNVIGVLAFKNHYCLWLYNGVFLKDKHNLLLNAQTGKTKALRQWRFDSSTEINEKLILEYIEEAIQNEKEGKIWKAERSKIPKVPEILEMEMGRNKELKSSFSALTPFKQKEYIEYLETAKRIDTKKSRLEKIIPMIMEGKGLNDKYRK